MAKVAIGPKLAILFHRRGYRLPYVFAERFQKFGRRHNFKRNLPMAFPRIGVSFGSYGGNKLLSAIAGDGTLPILRFFKAVSWCQRAKHAAGEPSVSR